MAVVLRASVVQLNSGDDVAANLRRCEHWVGRAAESGASFVVLPENFAIFGSESGKCAAAESLDGAYGPIVQSLSAMAKKHKVFLLGGGWPEKSDQPLRPYNTASLFDPAGQLVVSYRKIHLFDVTLPNGVALIESASTTAGDSVVVVDVMGTKVGLSICYDLRFPELYRAMVDRGAQLICVPSAFTAETGKDHWHLLCRARAVESQCWLLAANQWGAHGKGRSTYGHSLVCDPWGTVVAEASDREGFVVAELDMDWEQRIRERLPCLTHRRLHG